MKQDILNYVLENTCYPTMDDVSTKQVANRFRIQTNIAYTHLSALANEGKITKLDPVNGDSFDCCGWIENSTN